MSDEPASRPPAESGSTEQTSSATEAAARIAALERKVAELERAEQLKSALAATAPDALVVVDSDGRMVFVNRQVTDLFGYPEDELLGSPLEILLPERSRAAHVDHRHHYFALPRVRGMGSGLELWAEHASGRQFPVEISLSPIRLGDETLVASSIRDATERRDIEQRLRDSRERAEKATADKTRFIAATSHDLRQPLQAATIYLDLLSDGSLAAEKIGPTSRKAKECVGALRVLLNEILHISKLDAGVVTPRMHDFRIQSLFDHLGAQFEPVASAKGVDLRIRASLESVHSDPALIRRVLENLVSNAIRYTTSGGVLVGCRRGGDRLRLQVWDTGEGIGEDEVEKIFDAFYRSGESRSQDQAGLGLGLAIVRQIGSLLDHPVRLRSRPGRGSVFEVIVPRAEKGHPVAVREYRRPSQKTGSLVAVLDDSPAIVDALRTVLEVAGNRVVGGTSIEAVLDGLREEGLTPDALLTDYRLDSRTTGLDALRVLRREFGAAIPAIVLTGDSSFETLRRRAPEHDLRVLAKPVDAKRLLDELARSLDS